MLYAYTNSQNSSINSTIKWGFLNNFCSSVVSHNLACPIQLNVDTILMIVIIRLELAISCVCTFCESEEEAYQTGFSLRSP